LTWRAASSSCTHGQLRRARASAAFLRAAAARLELALPLGRALAQLVTPIEQLELARQAVPQTAELIGADGVFLGHPHELGQTSFGALELPGLALELCEQTGGEPRSSSCRCGDLLERVGERSEARVFCARPLQAACERSHPRKRCRLVVDEHVMRLAREVGETTRIPEQCHTFGQHDELARARRQSFELVDVVPQTIGLKPANGALAS
jgi:hypothetical protein